MNKMFATLVQKADIRPIVEKKLSGNRTFSLETKERPNKLKAETFKVDKVKQDDVVISLNGTWSSISATDVGFKQRLEQNRGSIEVIKVKSENKVAADTAMKLFDRLDDIGAIANLFKI
tara:strand:- start:1005 stop:1361 length:357 start_codon:yes stop_codon:yes gene_type:complete